MFEAFEATLAMIGWEIEWTLLEEGFCELHHERDAYDPADYDVALQDEARHVAIERDLLRSACVWREDHRLVRAVAV